MLRTIGQFGITLLVASTWSVVSSGNPLVLAKAIASEHPHSHLSTVTAQVPADSAPTRPQNSPNSKPTAGLRCISGCTPQYPAALAGEEGSARIKLVVDRNGNVVDAQVLGGSALTKFSVDENGNVVAKDGETAIYSKLAEAALASTKQMKFAPLESSDRAQVIVTVHFTIAGTNFDRKVRQRPAQNGREVQVEETNLTPLK